MRSPRCSISTCDLIGKLRAELQKIEKELAGPLFIASDCTPEGMARLLTLHGETLFHTDSDAGDALAAILGRYKQDSESSQTESLWLKSYGGEPVVIGRKKEGLLIIEEPCLSALFFMHARTGARALWEGSSL